MVPWFVPWFVPRVSFRPNTLTTRALGRRNGYQDPVSFNILPFQVISGPNTAGASGFLSVLVLLMTKALRFGLWAFQSMSGEQSGSCTCSCFRVLRGLQRASVRSEAKIQFEPADSAVNGPNTCTSKLYRSPKWVGKGPVAGFHR